MQTIQQAIAFVPIAVYFALVGALRLRRRPLVTTGWRDTLALGVALLGLVMIGPMQLFFPTHHSASWQGWIWLALLTLYFLGLILILLSCKPRLMVYGMDQRSFRQLMYTAAQQIDPASEWTGDVLTLPTSSMQLSVDRTGNPRIQQVVHVGLLHNLRDWILLERAMVGLAKEHRNTPRLAGGLFLLLGAFVMAFAVGPTINDPATAYAQLQEFINR